MTYDTALLVLNVKSGCHNLYIVFCYVYICQISNYYVVYAKPKLYVPYISIKKARVYHSSPLVPLGTYTSSPPVRPLKLHPCSAFRPSLESRISSLKSDSSNRWDPSAAVFPSSEDLGTKVTSHPDGVLRVKRGHTMGRQRRMNHSRMC